MKKVLALIVLAVAITAITAFAATSVTISFANAPSGVTINGGKVHVYKASDLSLAGSGTVSSDSVSISLTNGTPYVLKADFTGADMVAEFTLAANQTSISFDFTSMSDMKFNVSGYDEPVTIDVQVNYNGSDYTPALSMSTGDPIYYNAVLNVTVPERIGAGIQFYKLKSIKVDGSEVDGNSFTLSHDGAEHTIEIVYEQTYGMPELNTTTIIIIVAVVALIAAAAFMMFKKGAKASIDLEAVESRFLE